MEVHLSYPFLPMKPGQLKFKFSTFMFLIHIGVILPIPLETKTIQKSKRTKHSAIP